MQQLLSPYILIGLMPILLLAVLYYRRPLLVWIIKAIYGKYSFPYLKTTRKLYGEAPFAHGINTELVEHLHSFVKQVNEIEKQGNGSGLHFSDVKFGCTLAELINERSEPKYFNGKQNGKDRIMYAGYNKVIGGININELYFFINGEFFMGEYWFGYFTSNLSQEFFNSFYFLNGLGNIATYDNRLFCIKDTYGLVQLYEDNGFSVSVKYYKDGIVEKLRLQ